MKKSKEILELPIISIYDGEQLGRVKGLIINPEKFSVDFFTVEQENWQVSVRAIPFKKIIGIGESAMMVEQSNSVIDLNEIPFINQLINKQVHLIGSQVLTRKGDLLGEISDYFFSDETGQLDTLLINSENKELFFPIENVLSFGKERVIINDSLQEISEQIIKTSAKHESPTDKKAALTAKLIELLKANPLSKDIFSKNGDLLFEKGRILNNEDISTLKNEKAKVSIEISLDLKE
jgi:uncharacterized protein YrrD